MIFVVKYPRKSGFNLDSQTKKIMLSLRLKMHFHVFQFRLGVQKIIVLAK